MFRLALSTGQMRSIEAADEAVYRAARWIKQFHECEYLHIGWSDHPPGTDIADLLAKYGFVRVPRFEFNAIRAVLETYGPVLIRGAFWHRSKNEAAVPLPEISLTQVSTYEPGEHAIVLTGYWDGFQPRILYRDPSHPDRHFVVGLSRLQERIEPAGGIFYLACASLAKPCEHVVAAKASSK
jgi:hypothetical protein